MKQKNTFPRSGTFLYFFIAFFFLFMIDVRAYIDPSVMTYMIQAIAGAAIALGTVFGIFRTRIRKLFFQNSSSAFEEYEEDRIEFCDPKSGETVKCDHRAETAAGRKEKRFLPGILISFAMSFLLALYFPIQIYFTNLNEFEYDIYAVFGYLLLLFLILFCLLAAIFLLVFKCSKKAYYLCLTLASAALIAFFVQGCFLVSNLPATDGSSIDWNSFQKENLQSAVLWIAVLLGCGLIFWKFRKKGASLLAGFSSVIVMTVLLLSLVFSCISNHGLRHKTQLCISHDGLDTMSSEKNFVILVVDAVDSKTFHDLLDTSDPEFAEVFADFTYYPDTLAAYPFTTLAVPQILTGEWYECQDEFRSYYTDAMKRSPLLRRLREENYISGIYDMQDVIYEDPEFYEFENIDIRPYGLGDIKKFLLDELRMSYFMCMPFQLKRFQPYALFNLQNEAPADYFYQWYTPWISEFFRSRPIRTEKEKRFRYIHTEGAHPPYRYDKDLNNIEDSDEASYDNNVRACVTSLHSYLESLKASGTYDNTAIVILADHGLADHVHSEGRQNPLLLIKGFRESHAMEISEREVTYDDLQEIFAGLLDEKTGDQVLPETAPKSRRYIYYEYDNLNLLTEMELSGSTADDVSALKETGRVFAREDASNFTARQ